MIKIALLVVLAQVIVAAYADCSAENIEKLQSCYRVYVPNSPPAPELIPNNITSQIDLKEIGPLQCQAFAKLQACLNSDIIDTCIIPETFTRANGFSYAGAGAFTEGAQWVTHFKIYSRICAIDEDTHLEVVMCAAIAEKQFFSCRLDTCNDLPASMDCRKKITDSICPPISEEVIRESKIIACNVLENCDYCKEN